MDAVNLSYYSLQVVPKNVNLVIITNTLKLTQRINHEICSICGGRFQHLLPPSVHLSFSSGPLPFFEAHPWGRPGVWLKVRRGEASGSAGDLVGLTFWGHCKSTNCSLLPDLQLIIGSSFSSTYFLLQHLSINIFTASLLTANTSTTQLLMGPKAILPWKIK